MEIFSQILLTLEGEYIINQEGYAGLPCLPQDFSMT